MAEKYLESRVQHKRDTEANWEANDPILLDGELIFVEASDGNYKIKIGDGAKSYSQLPFFGEKEILSGLIWQKYTEHWMAFANPN